MSRETRTTRWGTALVAVMSALLGAAVQGQSFRVERVVSGVTRPTFVTQAPGEDGSLYITELNGNIKRFDLGTKSISLVASIETSAHWTGGLHALAFHPEFQTNGLFYVARSLDAYGAFSMFVNRIDEFRLDHESGVVSFSRNFLEVEHASGSNATHASDWVGFDPTQPESRVLYATIGDGYTNRSSPADSPRGKVLTFDTSAPIPEWQARHSGLRNPWRASFDRLTGDLFIGDVGLNKREEINFARAQSSGVDFGWAKREGTIAGPDGGAGEGAHEPIFEGVHGDGFASIVGGYVYRGPVRELQGQYFFADTVADTIWSGVFDRDTDPGEFNGANLAGLTNRTAQFNALRRGGEGVIDTIVSFGEDNAGNLYLVDYGNSFQPGPGSGQIFMIRAADDEDEDGLTLAEEGDLGTDPLNPDSDGDGASDGEEVLAGTDPLDPSSFFVIDEIRLDESTGDVSLEWKSLAGREYVIMVSTDLEDWTELATVPADEGGTTIYVDFADPPRSESRFYVVEARYAW